MLQSIVENKKFTIIARDTIYSYTMSLYHKRYFASIRRRS